ncbi:MAG: imidazoleglycerol-phosphate dehydratase HisB [Deferribacteraceae bacterium]|jgi:imidazoleglycerol-phosphate dehydratase|nr:imidazoleglycerol-phosphate dehydratase HisB [Deferribacteraceae bacterium]
MTDNISKPRQALVSRNTSETKIALSLNLGGSEIEISTGIGFMDHMLNLFAHHGGFGLTVNAVGDTHIDDHHTVEDLGIALGRAFDDAAGDKNEIVRYGQMLLPMDEALVEAAVDFGGRGFLHLDLPFRSAKTGTFDLQLVEEFFRALAVNAKITLHINLRYGKNDHHIAEAAFKAVARALKQAVQVYSGHIPSTKGIIDG